MTASAGVFDVDVLKELLSACRDTINTLQTRYDEIVMGGGEEIDRLTQERDQKINEIIKQYDDKMARANANNADIDKIKREAIKQIKNFRDLKGILERFGHDTSDLTLQLPEDFAKAVLGELMSEFELTEAPEEANQPKFAERTVKRRGRPARHNIPREVEELPTEDLRSYTKIKDAIRDMFADNGNKPLGPKDIMDYFNKQGHSQEPNSIRTQLSTLKRAGVLSHDKARSLYWWADESELKKTAKH